MKGDRYSEMSCLVSCLWFKRRLGKYLSTEGCGFCLRSGEQQQHATNTSVEVTQQQDATSTSTRHKKKKKKVIST